MYIYLQKLHASMHYNMSAITNIYRGFFTYDFQKYKIIIIIQYMYIQFLPAPLKRHNKC
jgi:hypothetical protein